MGNGDTRHFFLRDFRESQVPQQANVQIHDVIFASCLKADQGNNYSELVLNES
jgi:hypothetical protein